MNIGIVSTWFERGAAYVSKAYIEALKNNNHKIFVYARGGEKFAKDDASWNNENVTWGLRLSGTNISKKDLYKWIKGNNIEVIFFNEQHELSIVAMLKRDFVNLKIGSYIDYYKENTISLFNIYDFIICNTKRHYIAFEQHTQKYYIPWGTDINIFSPNYSKNERKEQLIFFHSAGMSDRKGTDLVIEAFIKGQLYIKSKLIIHTQINIEKISGYEISDLKGFNIEIIQKTVAAPGLYHLGDVYVYPTKLEGLGLTIFEALASGMPVIVTNNAPMNEVVDSSVGKLVNVERYYARSDGYYWPLSLCNLNSLIDCMNYYIINSDQIETLSLQARNYAESNLNWKMQYDLVNEAFEQSEIKKVDLDLCNKIIQIEKREKLKRVKSGVNLNNFIGHLMKSTLDIRRKNQN